MSKKKQAVKFDTIASEFGLPSSFCLFSRVYARFLGYEAPIAICE
jgi:hypothetical protein